MQKYNSNITDAHGNALPFAVVTVTDSMGNLAQIYSANDVTKPLANPLTTDVLGNFSFYATNGRYSWRSSGLGFASAGVTDFVLYDPADAPPASLAQLASNGGAAMVGTSTGATVEAAIAANVSNITANTSDLTALQLADYTALRAYAGSRKSVYVTTSGIAGMFVLRADLDPATAVDNGGTRIVGAHVWDRESVTDIHAAWFGEDPTGVIDSTAAIQAAVDTAYANGGGTVRLSAGVIRVDGTISRSFAASIPVNLAGLGQFATTLKRVGSSTAAVIAWSSPTSILNNYSLFSGFSIVGNGKAHDGIALTNVARFVLNRIRISACNNAINNAGSLVYRQIDCTLESNNVGIISRSANAVSANLVEIVGGQISANTTLGVDLGGGTAWRFTGGVDLSANGTAGDQTTGAVLIRSSVTAETGYAIISFDHVWLEANKGWAIRTEGSPDLNISMRDVTIAGTEAGRCVSVPEARHFVAENVIAASVGDTVTIAATNTVFIGGTITTLNDTSTYRNYLGLNTSSQASANTTSQLYIDGPAGNNTIIGNDSLIGGGSANDFSLYHYGSGEIMLWAGGQKNLRMSGTGIAFNGAPPVAKPSITGSRSGNAALASVAAALATLGLATDNTTA